MEVKDEFFSVKEVSYREKGHFFPTYAYGCLWDCEYCFLKTHTKYPFPVITKFNFSLLENVLPQAKRIHFGEVSDGLQLEKITNLVKKTLYLAEKYPNVIFEFRTKAGGKEFENLLPQNPPPNVVISFSLNPPKYRKYEHRVPPPEKRIELALKLQDMGYKIGLRFDPLILQEGWEEEYTNFIHSLPFDEKKLDDHTELGVLRGTPELIIEILKRDTDILSGEFVPSFDGKWRYTKFKRVQAFKLIGKEILNKYPSQKIEIIMESEDVKELVKFE